MKLTHYAALAAVLLTTAASQAQTVPLKYGNFDHWVTRNIKESGLVGGNTKTVYAIGPDQTLGTKAYTPLGGSPWATSNVMAKVMGITKGSNAVYPAVRAGHGKCAKLSTEMEHVKAIGLINMDVVVAGTVFLGRMFEPISSTKNPYSKMEMGIEYDQRPQALQFDYLLDMPGGNTRTYSSGFGAKRTLAGADKAVALVLLQRRWEDADGNLHARRVGTGHELYGRSSGGWVNHHRVPIHYGEAAEVYRLIPKHKSYYARNSKGKLVPVIEEGWDSADAQPTHLIVLFSSGAGEPYTGTLGTDFYIDNVAMVK